MIIMMKQLRRLLQEKQKAHDTSGNHGTITILKFGESHIKKSQKVMMWSPIKKSSNVYTSKLQLY